MSLEPKHQSWQFPRYQQFNKQYYSGYVKTLDLTVEYMFQLKAYI